MFYNAGNQTHYAPFPAQVIAPLSGQTVSLDANNEITLSWQGADIENDIISYELYTANTSVNDLVLVQSSLAGSYTTNDFTSGDVVYWKVITEDTQGNTSDSGVFDFRVD